MKENFKEGNHNTDNHSTKSNNSNIILNQNGVPCYNNINIYTNGVNPVNTLKTGDINLRQYIFSKMNKKGSGSVSKNNNKSLSHARSNSSAGQ